MVLCSVCVSFMIDLVLPHVNWAQFQLTTDTSLRQSETVYNFLNTWNYMSRTAEQLEKRINYLFSYVCVYILYRLNITLLQKGQMSHSDHLQRAKIQQPLVIIGFGVAGLR